MKPWEIIASDVLDIISIVTDLLDTSVAKDVKWVIKNDDGTVSYVYKPNLAKILEIYDGKLTDTKNEIEQTITNIANDITAEAKNYTDSKIIDINTTITTLEDNINTTISALEDSVNTLKTQVQSILINGVSTTSDTNASSSMLVDMKTYTGDGTTTEFSVVFLENYVEVFVNGVLKTPDVDYTVDVNKVIFKTPPAAGDSIILYGYYLIDLSELAIPATVISGTYTATGGETEIPVEFSNSGVGIVTKNGLDITSDVTLTSDTITFNTPLDAGDVIRYYLFTTFKVVDIDALMPLLDPPILGSYSDVLKGESIDIKIVNYDQFATYTIVANNGTITYTGGDTFTYTAPSVITGDMTDTITVKVEKTSYRANIATYNINVLDIAFNTDQQLINTDFTTSTAYVENIEL